MRESVVSLLLALALAVAHAAAFEADLSLRDDPYLSRVVEEAVEMGEHSVLSLALSGAATSVSALESPRDLESSLLAVSAEIMGTPAPRRSGNVARANARAAASAGGVSFVSVDEHAAFEELLGKTEAGAEEAELIARKKAEILADRASDAALLQEFQSLSAGVDAFQAQLTQEDQMSFADATVSAEEAAEADAEEAAAQAAEHEEQADFEADVAAELGVDLDAEADAEAEEEADVDADAEESAEADLEAEYDFSSFLELGSAVKSAAGADAGAGAAAELQALLAALPTPTAEEEALEPTLSEEAEALAQGHQAPSASFLLTEEELTAQLDALAKQL